MTTALYNFLFKQIDNSALIIFRICFGLLCFLESVGAIFTGWVTKTMINPKFTFSFIGFEWLQPLDGSSMYIYYAVMGVFGLFIMLGYRYRLSILTFTVLWSASYLMQKSSYNNHYYLLMLLSSIMVFMPANTYASLDVKYNYTSKKIAMPNWCKWIIVLQLLIVYSYAALAKCYPDWLNGTFIKLLMQSKAHYPIVGELLQNKTTHYFLSYGGLLYDGLIIPLLLFKPTRKFAFFASLFFNLFNSFVIQVGIFPYLALAFSLFFFEAKTIHTLFLKHKPLYTDHQTITPKYKTVFLTCACIYFLVQIGLPLRHYFIKDPVLWTEEGHRLSWRMMLRSKHGIANYTIINKTTNDTITVNLDNYLTQKQKHSASTKPDMIWQFSQYLKNEYAKKNETIAVFVNCRVSINGRPYKQLINPNIDLTKQKWEPFKHCNWILPSK